MKEIVVGRTSDNNVTINDKTVSSHHVRFMFEAGVYYVEDLHSLNGTYVNGQLLRSSSRQLKPQDIVRIGNQTLPWLRYFDGSFPIKNISVNINAHNHDGGNVIPPPPSQPKNGLAIAGFVCSFFPFICVAGLVMSILGVVKANDELNGLGRGLAIAGIAISGFWLLLGLFILNV